MTPIDNRNREKEHFEANTTPAPAAGRSLAAGKRLITVIGKLNDTVEFIDRDGFNVLERCNDWTPELNQRFIDDAIDRGDALLFVSYDISGQYRNELIQIIRRLMNE